MTVRNEEKKAFRDLTPEERGEIVEARIRGFAEYYGEKAGVWFCCDGEYLRLSGIYRTKPRFLSIPWESINPRYNFAAIDRDGDLWLYTEKPDCFERAWESSDGMSDAAIILNIDTTGIDWRDSLTERPEGV